MRKLAWFAVGFLLVILMATGGMLGGLRTTSAEGATPSPGSPIAASTHTPQPTQQPTPTPEASASWQRQRTISGDCGSLRIEGVNQVYYAPCNQGYQLGNLTEDEFRTYLVYLARYAPFNYSASGDQTVHLTFAGRGSRQPAKHEQAEMADWIGALYDRLICEEQRANLEARARQLLAQSLGISPDAVRSLSVEAVTWSDACLEIKSEGLYCAQVLTPGYRIRLEAAGLIYEYHTNMRDLVRQVEGPIPMPTDALPSPEPTEGPTVAPTATPWPTVVPVVITEWRGEYYANPWTSGQPSLVRNEERICFDWGDGSPAGDIPVNHFSARFTRRLDLPAGRYRLRAVVDDGVRVYVDDQLVIDGWRVGDEREYLHEMRLEGTHELRVEYFENESRAMIRFDCQRSRAPKPKS